MLHDNLVACGKFLQLFPGVKGQPLAIEAGSTNTQTAPYIFYDSETLQALKGWYQFTQLTK